MPDDPIPSSTLAFVLPAQDDFDAMLAAVMDTPHGRWFLQEFARRQRGVDVQDMLAAVERIGTIIARDRIDFADQNAGARAALCEMTKVIADNRADLPDALPPARVLDDLDRRIGAWLASTATDPRLEPPGQTPDRLAARDLADTAGHTDGNGAPLRPIPAGPNMSAPCIPSMWEPEPPSPSLRKAEDGPAADERDH
jgi:hypothetical protein